MEGPEDNLKNEMMLKTLWPEQPNRLCPLHGLEGKKMLHQLGQFFQAIPAAIAGAVIVEIGKAALRAAKRRR